MALRPPDSHDSKSIAQDHNPLLSPKPALPTDRTFPSQTTHWRLNSLPLQIYWLTVWAALTYKGDCVENLACTPPAPYTPPNPWALSPTDDISLFMLWILSFPCFPWPLLESRTTSLIPGLPQYLLTVSSALVVILHIRSPCDAPNPKSYHIFRCFMFFVFIFFYCCRLSPGCLALPGPRGPCDRAPSNAPTSSAPVF